MHINGGQNETAKDYQKTIQSFRADLASDDESLNMAVLLRKMQKDNPELARAVENMSGDDAGTAGKLLCLCEILERQMESDEMAKTFR